MLFRPENWPARQPEESIMFARKDTLLLVIDMQERLLPHIQAADQLTRNLLTLIECCKILGLPILVTEQYPEGIGATVAALAPALAAAPKISKRTFSCCREAQFIKQLGETGKKQIMIAGIETHVCVFQTAADLLPAGYAVEVVADAVGARAAANHAIGLERMKALGADITSLESAVFELLATSAGPEFKQILRYLK